jgi:hypothetical protein
MDGDVRSSSSEDVSLSEEDAGNNQSNHSSTNGKVKTK